MGTWKLVSASSTTPSGERDETPYGPGPSGFLTYTADGRVTALISYGGRKPLSGLSSPHEQAEAFKTFIAYAGRYTFSGKHIVHHVEISSIQNYVNKDLVRIVKFDGDRVTLITPPTLVNGKMQTVDALTERRLGERALFNSPDVNIEQNTTYNITGHGALDIAGEVSRNVRRDNGDLLRNMEGVIG